MLWYLIAIATIAIVYYWIARPYKYWTDRGVKQGPIHFLFGDNWGIMTKKQSFADMVRYVYNIVPNTRYSGMYQFLLPTLVVKDPELIKQITVKDFDHFMDHRSFIPEGVDPLWSKNLVALTGKMF